jgi:hypothetical protein
MIKAESDEATGKKKRDSNDSDTGPLEPLLSGLTQTKSYLRFRMPLALSSIRDNPVYRFLPPRLSVMVGQRM